MIASCLFNDLMLTHLSHYSPSLTLTIAILHILDFMTIYTYRFVLRCFLFELICRSFGAKDEIFCLFQGSLDNLGSLKQQYGLAKNANEVLLVIEAYKTLRDRAPYPANHVVAHLSGDFAFVVFDKSTSTLFVASVSCSFLIPFSW